MSKAIGGDEGGDSSARGACASTPLASVCPALLDWLDAPNFERRPIPPIRRSSANGPSISNGLLQLGPAQRHATTTTTAPKLQVLLATAQMNRRHEARAPAHN